MRGTMVPVVAVVAIVVIALVAFVLVRAPAPQLAGPPTTAAPKPASTSGSPVAAGKPSGQVPTTPHPTPQEETFKGCPGEGDGTDPELNRLKNRVDEAAWQPVTVEALLGLKWPEDIGRKHMAQWTQPDRAQIGPFNGVPVQTEGYLLQVRQEGPESPNCHSAEDFVISTHSGQSCSAMSRLMLQRTRAHDTGSRNYGGNSKLPSEVKAASFQTATIGHESVAKGPSSGSLRSASRASMRRAVP